MSNRPDETLLDAVVDAPVLAAAVEAHLDAYPLPVDDDEVLASVDRLEARLGLRQPANSNRAWIVGAALLLAAAAIAAMLALPEEAEVTHVPSVAKVEVLQSTTPPTLERIETTRAETQIELIGVDRTLTLEPETRLISSQAERSAVILVQKGRVHDAQIDVPAEHWAVFGRSDQGTAQVVFRDGEAPPELDPEVYDVEVVHQQLKQVRWESLPDRTLETLDRLLEKGSPPEQDAPGQDEAGR